jgi:hypothetical protein
MTDTDPPPAPGAECRPKARGLRYTLVAAIVLVVAFTVVQTSMRKAEQARHQTALGKVSMLGGSVSKVGVQGRSPATFLPGFIRRLLPRSWFPQRTHLKIDFSSTRISDNDLVCLLDLQDLYALDLTSTAISDAGMDTVAQLTSLESLELRFTNVTDYGLAKITTLKRLRSLVLVGTEVTDDGLMQLQAFEKLKSLNLRWALVTDRGLNHLQALTSLEALYLSASKVSDKGVRTLKVANPNLSVDFKWDDGGRPVAGTRGTGSVLRSPTSIIEDQAAARQRSKQAAKKEFMQKINSDPRPSDEEIQRMLKELEITPQPSAISR